MSQESILNPDIFLYADWRAYVRAWLSADPRGGRTKGRLAEALGCVPSQVTNLLHSEPSRRRKLSQEYEERLIKALGLDELQGAFFRLLVRYDRAEVGSEAHARAFAEICAHQRFRNAHAVTVEQYELMSSWVHVAILELARAPSFRGDPQWIRDKLSPRVQLQQVQRAFDTLLRLGFLKYEPSGHVVPAHDVVLMDPVHTPGAPSIRDVRRDASHEMSRWMLDRAKEALTEFNSRERQFMASTQLVPASRLPEVMAMIERWHREWIELCLRSEEDDSIERGRVYRLNTQLFPLSEWLEGAPAVGQSARQEG